MTRLTVVTLLAAGVWAMSEVVSYEAISKLQVYMRTLNSSWALDLEYAVDAASDRDPSKNFLYVTTVLRNNKFFNDFKRKLKDGEIF